MIVALESRYGKSLAISEALQLDCHFSALAELIPLEGEGSSERTDNSVVVVIVLSRSSNPDNTWSH